jgi:gluconolactonase
MAWPAAAQDVDIAARAAYTESPTVDGEGNVYFCESGSERILKMATKGVLSSYRDKYQCSGLLVDPEQRMIMLGLDVKNGQSKPAVTRVDLRTGKEEVLCDNYQGTPLHAPNDVSMDAKGRLYWTDRPAIAVYRTDAPGKTTRILGAPDVEWPNGIVVSPDDKTLYVIETNQKKGGARRINAYDLAPDGTASHMRVFYDFYPGRSADGMSIDVQGNVYACGGLNWPASLRFRPSGTSETMDTKAGVYVISAQGKLLKFIPVPEDTVTNDTFGGPDNKTLYITAGKTLFKVRIDIPGLPNR